MNPACFTTTWPSEWKLKHSKEFHQNHILEQKKVSMFRVTACDWIFWSKISEFSAWRRAYLCELVKIMSGFQFQCLLYTVHYGVHTIMSESWKTQGKGSRVVEANVSQFRGKTSIKSNHVCQIRSVLQTQVKIRPLQISSPFPLPKPSLWPRPQMNGCRPCRCRCRCRWS